MIRSILLSLSFLIISYVQAQTTKTTKVSDFNKVVFGGNFEVLLEPSSQEGLVLSGSQRDLDRIKTEVRGGTLYVEFEKSYRIRTRIEARLSYKQLESIVLAGSGKIENNDKVLKSKNLSLKIMGSGDIDLTVKVENLESAISGSGDIELRGQATIHEARISGAGDINCENLTANEVDVKVSGSGDVRVSVKNSLNAKVSGSGNITYKGNPKTLKTKVSGSGKVRKVEEF